MLNVGGYWFADRDAQTPAGADRMPTADEAAVADKAAKNVDLEKVGANERGMLKVGADVKGEGELP